MIIGNKLQFYAKPRNTISIQVPRHELEIAQHILPRTVHGTRRRSVTDGRLPTDLTRETCRSGKENKRKKKRKRRGGRKEKPANRSGHRSMTHIAPPLVSPPSLQHPLLFTAVIQRCFHNVLPSNLFPSVLPGPVNWMANGEERWRRHLGQVGVC